VELHIARPGFGDQDATRDPDDLDASRSGMETEIAFRIVQRDGTGARVDLEITLDVGDEDGADAEVDGDRAMSLSTRSTPSAGSRLRRPKVPSSRTLRSLREKRPSLR
jgi:hypothetical protein